ncbi:S-layer homology domain-containing protein [Paenibacillaceae bacterium]|nr:S-layer homology domain-containing protein [Paenibacillaceae bacterium]
MKHKKNKKSSKKQVLLTLSTALALTTALPAAAHADERIYSSAAGQQSLPPAEWTPASKAEGPQTSVTSDQGGSETQTESPDKAKISKEKAVSLAKELVSIPDDYTLQSTSFNTETLSAGKRTVWNLYFAKKVKNRNVGSINVSIDATSGELRGYSTYLDDPTRKPVYPPKVDRAAAQQIATEFIGKVSPKYKDELVYNADFGIEFRPPLNGDVRYSLRYDRLVNDVAFKDNFIDIEVDGEGHIMQYSIRWDDTVTFDNEKPGITLEQATAKIREQAALELSYLTNYNIKSPAEPHLTYSMPSFMLSAKDGSVWSPYEQSRKPNTTKPVNESSLGAKPTGGKKLDAEQSAAAVKAAFTLPEGAELTDSGFNEYENEYTGRTVSAWNLNWSIKKDGKQAGSAWASINSQTGQVTNYSYYMDNDYARQSGQKITTITYEAAEKKALEVIKKQLPGYVHELYLQDDSERYATYSKEDVDSIRDYSFSFQRRVNGALVDSDGVYISVNAITGEVRNYNVQLSDFAFPASLPSVISKEKAIDAFMDYYKVELTYVSPALWNGHPIPFEKYNLMVAAGEIAPGAGGEGGTQEKAKLVYRLVERPLDERVFLDAQTGEWRDLNTGDKTELVKPQASDIVGHWAERELGMMVAYKALDLTDGKVNPNAIVTRGEVIKMLVLSMNSGRRPYYEAMNSSADASFKDVGSSNAYFLYVESAVEQNLIDKGDGSFNPEGKVTREEMAELIVRALGYNTLAKREGLFDVKFKDAADIENKGQAAIVAGLKIMSQNAAGNFQPKREVTRAEASAAFFRFLQARADLQEAPLRN